MPGPAGGAYSGPKILSGLRARHGKGREGKRRRREGIKMEIASYSDF